MAKLYSLETQLEEARKLNKRHKAALERLEIQTIKDLLFHFPSRYDDFSTITPISETRVNETNTIKGEIIEIQNKKTRKRYLTITQATVSDESGSIEAVWFRQPFLEKYLTPGTIVTLSGKVEHGFSGALQIKTPVYEIIKEDGIHTGRITPVYPETAGITSKWLRRQIANFMKLSAEITDPLPEEILKKNKLPNIETAIRNIHFPSNHTELQNARYRFAFQEMFLLQLLNKKKYINFKQDKAYPIPYENKVTLDFLKTLPFELTSDQKKASWHIFKDLEKNTPMNRLLEGDVGSGKTLVATLALLHVVKNNYQGMLLAPTEILAKQHFETLKKHLGEQYSICLLTRSQHQRTDKSNSSIDQTIEDIGSGEIAIIIGTHTLLNEKIKTKNCALAIIDEQHRFGVKQRARVKKCNKGKTAPHFLSMTATPIPRTLALSLYGDLDLSIIKEMPKNRKPIKTHLVNPQKRTDAYEYIRKKVAEGDQVFVVCPLIEESDKLGVKSATEEFEKLNEHIFPEIPVGLLHGKMKKDEKENIMKHFSQNKMSILVSTSVVEVGIDVPNATIMMIEGAERFGLAQLHQFRGRVGRGEKQSFCFLFSDSRSEKTFERLDALTKTNSGFDLAQKDLETRGPGEVYGVRQSGLPDLKMASLTDFALVETTRQQAEKLLSSDVDLKKYPKLKKALQAFEQTTHFE